jgi:hypothetical protein
MSYLLVRERRPPFVLTVENAKAYFDPSTLIRQTQKHSFAMLFRMPKLKRRFARFLQDQADKRFLASARARVDGLIPSAQHPPLPGATSR